MVIIKIQRRQPFLPKCGIDLGAYNRSETQNPRGAQQMKKQQRRRMDKVRKRTDSAAAKKKQEGGS
jgi:hypothetical protein